MLNERFNSVMDQINSLKSENANLQDNYLKKEQETEDWIRVVDSLAKENAFLKQQLKKALSDKEREEPGLLLCLRSRVLCLSMP